MNLMQKKEAAIRAFANPETYNPEQLMAQYNIPRTTLSLWHSSFKKNKSILIRKVREKGPRKVTERHRKLVRKILIEKPQITVASIKVRIDETQNLKNLSHTSVREIVRSMSKLRKTAFQPQITREHEIARVKYCKEHERKMFKTWVFTDESSFELKVKKTYRQLNGGKRYIIPKKAQKQSVMVWGAIAHNRKFPLCIVRGAINANAYIKIIHNFMMSWYPSGQLRGKWTFMQDNAPSHNAWITKRYLREMGINVANHPARSPDLNPIEEIWSDMKKEISKYNFTTTDQLAKKLLDIWDNFDQELINKRIFRLRAKMKEVMRLDGKISDAEILPPIEELSDEEGIPSNNPCILESKNAPQMKILARHPEEQREEEFKKMIKELGDFN